MRNFSYTTFDEDGYECSVWDELSAYFDSAGEDFGPESPRHKKDNPYGRRHVAAAALGDMDFEVFLEEYQECFEFSPKVISGYADNDFEMNMEDDVLEKIDPSTFMGFTVEYEAHEIPDEYVRETEHGRRVDLDAFLKKYRTDMEEGKESILEEEHYAIGFAAMPGVREKKSGKRTA